MSFLDILLYERDRERERLRFVYDFNDIHCLVIDVQDVRQYSVSEKEHLQLLKYTEQLQLPFVFFARNRHTKQKKWCQSLTHDR